MTISEWLHHAGEALSASGCPDPAVDARWIAEDMLNMTTSALRFEGQKVVPPEALQTMNE